MGMDGGNGSLDTARVVAADNDATTLDAACFELARAHPDRSAQRTFHYTQIVALVAAIALLAAGLDAARAVTLSIVHYVGLAVFATAILWRLLAAAHCKRLLSRLAAPQTWPTYTILCPVYREANVIPELIAGIDALAYPKHALDVKLLVEADDHDTLSVARAVAVKSHLEVLVIPPAAPRTKPKALNVGLARARGEYLVVYDAEDRPEPHQLLAALAAFEDGGEKLACVQAPLAIDNLDSSWIARQFAAEYAIQFREILPLLARLKLPLPLGGTSNHFRVNCLRAAGGWDPFNVREKYCAFAA